MSRQATTVAQLYTEWFTGLGDKPSVVQMDRQFGTKWRSENKEKVFYSVRKTIIDHVEDRRRGGESLDAVLRHLQGTMVARSKGLQALSLAIRNWQHPGGRKKKDEDWYEGPGTASALALG
jgi:Transcriptional activator of glycolytic enzymes